MTDAPVLIPLEAIDAAALPRDRSALDPAALEELKLSIFVSGLRMPIEVYAVSTPDGGPPYGLISGFRRLAAMRALHEGASDRTRYAAIPAFVRAPKDAAEALTAMVEENAIRAELSPWEQGAVAVAARDAGVFDTIEAAIEALYSRLGRDRRRRFRAIAHLVEAMEGRLVRPETQSLRRLLRLASAVARGYGPVMEHALVEGRTADPEAQWRLLEPICAEAERPEDADPTPGDPEGRPRRIWRAPTRAIHLRRERTREGWLLHVTGRDASGLLMNTIFDEIERMLEP